MIKHLGNLIATVTTRVNGKMKYHLVGVASVALVAGGATSVVYASNKYSEQINSLKSQNQTSRSEQQNLKTEAGSLAATISSLQAEINALEGQIRDNRAKDAQIKQAIAAAEADLAKEKQTLAANIKQVYVDNEMSTLEMLATSKDLGDYIDKAQYRNNVQAKINASVARIDALKAQLDKQQKEVQQLLADQQAMQARVQEQRAENNRLLALNKDEQAKIDGDIKARNAQITELQRKQAAENARYNVGKAVTGGSGGYPWANVSYPSYSVDPWGMYKRECVSYAAWKVHTSGRYMPYWGGKGNAKLWDDNARAAGIPVDTNPRVGDVAVSNAGRYGHVMYVEAVHSDGTITVSQYNASWDGKYSEVRRATTGLVFIHF